MQQFENFLLCKFLSRHNYRCDLPCTQGRIRDIADRCERLGIKNLGEGSSGRTKELQLLRRSPPLTKDKDVVGLEEKTRFLIS